VPTRWIDQGASQALPIFRVASRLDSGLVETLFGAHVADKTAWQAMLKGPNAPLDLHGERDRLMALLAPALDDLSRERGLNAVTALEGDQCVHIDYPMLQYPTKVKSVGFDKQPEVGGTLLGIKGQYLIFDDSVINIRKHAGYRVSVNVEGESTHA
jgi:hypothetical protein